MLYTSGNWRAKPGSEQAFIDAWRELADWTFANVEGASFAKLLQDTDDPGHFLSFGPWASEEAVAAWRAHPGFIERVARITELLDSFQPSTYTMAAEVGPPTPDPT